MTRWCSFEFANCNDEQFPALNVTVLHDALLQVPFLFLGAGGAFFALFVFLATCSLLFVGLGWVVFVGDSAAKINAWVAKVLVGLDSAVTIACSIEGGNLVELPVDFVADETFKDAAVFGFSA